MKQKNKLTEKQKETIGWIASVLLLTAYVFFALNKMRIFILLDIFSSIILVIYNLYIKSMPNAFNNFFITIMLVIGYIKQFGVGLK